MKSFKFLPLAAIFACYAFSSVAISQVQVCPIGAGACSTRQTPASSYSNARSVDIMIRQPIPVMQTPEQLALTIAPLLPTTPGNVTTSFRVAELNGIYTKYFCVAGRGENLGQMYLHEIHPVYGDGYYLQSACPAGSGAMVIGRSTLPGGDGVGDQ